MQVSVQKRMPLIASKYIVDAVIVSQLFVSKKAATTIKPTWTVGVASPKNKVKRI